MKLGDLCGGSRIWANWWGVPFIIAQTFQLFSVAGYATMELSMYLTWEAKTKAYFAMSLIATISYFLVTVGVLIFNCKQQAKAFLILGTAAYIAQMAIYTTWPLNYTWQFGVGWAGAGNGVVAIVFMFLMKNESFSRSDNVFAITFSNKSEPITKFGVCVNESVQTKESEGDVEKKNVASISGLLNCMSFVFYNIAFAGFFGWTFDDTSVFSKSMTVIDVLGFCFLGLATFFSIYHCKQGKMITTALAFCCTVTAMGMVSSNYITGGSETIVNMFASGWISVGLSLVALIMCFLEKDQE